MGHHPKSRRMDKMPLDLQATHSMFQGMRAYPVAVTTAHEGRTNGLMSLSGALSGILHEAPRVSVSITKYNFSHDLVLKSGVFAMHVLSNDPLMFDASLKILMTLGGSSGRDGEKIPLLRTQVGVTHCPILLDALSYVEVRITGSLDNDENTIFVGDVVAAERLNAGSKMDIGTAWAKLPSDWVHQYESNHIRQENHCRVMRGIQPIEVN
ncbi:MAG: High molecular weight rubredoxin [Nitrosomonadaceae bacterium]|nr:High molecular weight rubredoxin [Nitrosomonadaceae bacterium]